MKKHSIKIYYDLGQRKVVRMETAAPAAQPIPSSYRAFEMPLFFSLDGLLLFPTKYEIFSRGTVLYHATQPPHEGIEVLKAKYAFDEGSTEVSATVTAFLPVLC